mmetsp:Transcript_23883/g.49634  ORF Transcript_23883/g.49634 Transcript_23883/m.49634 type:complete len:529 (+) Transcript_23883:112-1698(+)
MPSFCKIGRRSRESPALAVQADGDGCFQDGGPPDGMYNVNKKETMISRFRKGRIGRSWKVFKCLSPFTALREVRHAQTWPEDESLDFLTDGRVGDGISLDGSELPLFLRSGGINSQNPLAEELFNQAGNLRVVEEGNEWEDELDDGSERNIATDINHTNGDDMNGNRMLDDDEGSLDYSQEEDEVMLEEGDVDEENIRIGIQPLLLQRPPELDSRYAARAPPPPSTRRQVQDEPTVTTGSNTLFDMSRTTSSSSFASSSAPPSINLARQPIIPRGRPDPPATKITDTIYEDSTTNTLDEKLREQGPELSIQHNSDRTVVSELTSDSCFSDFTPRHQYPSPLVPRPIREKFPSRPLVFPEASLSGKASMLEKHVQRRGSPVTTVSEPAQSHESARMRALIGKFESLANTKATIERYSLLSKLEAAQALPVQTSPSSVMADISSISRETEETTNRLYKKMSPPRGNSSPDRGFFWRSNPPTAAHDTSDTCPEDSDFEQSTASRDLSEAFDNHMVYHPFTDAQLQMDTVHV